MSSSAATGSAAPSRLTDGGSAFTVTYQRTSSGSSGWSGDGYPSGYGYPGGYGYGYPGGYGYSVGGDGGYIVIYAY